MGVAIVSVESEDWLPRELCTGLEGLLDRTMSGDIGRNCGISCRHRSMEGTPSGTEAERAAAERASEDNERLEEAREGREGRCWMLTTLWSSSRWTTAGPARVMFVHSSASVTRSMEVTMRKSRRLMGTPPCVR